MKPNLHIYSASIQPAHNYLDRNGPGRARRFRCSPRRVIYCHDCQKPRWASKLCVQVYYDLLQFFCRNKDDCKKARKGNP